MVAARFALATRRRTGLGSRNGHGSDSIPSREALGWEYASSSDRIARMARTNSSKPARAEQASGEEAPNPVWFKPVMFGFMLLGLAWIIVFYVSQGRLPIADLGSWNILIGFGIAFVGFLMTTRWR